MTAPALGVYSRVKPGDFRPRTLRARPMTTISEKVTIRADIEAVFDLICRVEEFPLYADFLTEVRKIGYRTYRWVAEVQGITFTWDSVITEFRRPVRLAWRSVRGLQNAGAYTLRQLPQGTEVSIRIEYHLPGHFLEALTAPFAEPLAHSIAAQILERVKRRLESEAHPQSTLAGAPAAPP
jgi:uncharacterized membrane protein